MRVAATGVTADDRYEQFSRIDGEKRERILRAALEEFADKEYAQASTNTIVAKAGISKGLLFHYFGDKAGLFRYLQAYTTEILLSDIFAQTDLSGSDLFEVLHRICQAKLNTTARHPLEVRFYARILTSDLPPELRDTLDNTIGQSYDNLNFITNNLDTSLLKDGLRKEQVAKIVYWVSEGMVDETLATLDPKSGMDEYSQLTRYVEEYFDLLRRLFYKGEAD
jgi:AcrR family transcriptional regulator